MRRWGAVVLGVLMTVGVSEAFSGDVAVVVSHDNAVNDISFNELVKIFKQERQFWKPGKRIYLLMRESGGPEREVLLEKIYHMPDDKLKKFWMAKLYRGEIPAFPKTLGSNESVKRFVSQVPTAIGVIDASTVDDSVKVLRIDGRAPGDSGYPLDVK